MDATVWGPLAASVIGALLLYTYNRHRPKVDNSAEQRGWFNEVQEERDKAVERAEKAEARAETCEVGKREVEGRNDDLLRQTGALAHELDALYAYVLANFHGLASGMVPPLLTPPYVLHERLPPDSIPYIVARRFDTGVPGVDPNPPFPDPPSPPDDGQDTDHTKE